EAVLPADGSYAIVLAQSSFGGTYPLNYQFEVSTPLTATTVLTLGTAYSATLSGRNDQQLFTFAGTTGQRLYFDDLGSSGSLSWQLTGPTGQPPAFSDDITT